MRVWLGLFACLFLWPRGANAATPPLRARVLTKDSAELTDGTISQVVERGERFGRYTLMALQPDAPAYAVLEEFAVERGVLLFVSEQGVVTEFAKTAESSQSKRSGYLLGYTAEQLRRADTDLLADKLLAGNQDPDYAQVAAVFPPTQVIKSDTFDFLGGLSTNDKIGFTYGGSSPSLNPAIYQPSLAQVQKARRVWHGLVGGYLPVTRFVYPETPDTFTELVAFAPLRMLNANPAVQPVWYRLTRVEQGRFVWSRYVDTYQPIVRRSEPDPRAFYADLLAHKAHWDALLSEAMEISLPDERLSNLARHSLVRVMMTRVADYPHYGVVDKDYGGSQHDGFLDTFNVETATMTAWGMHTRARRIINNYLSKFVRDDGSILYRGLEIGQLGRMLSVLADYARTSRDFEPLLAFRARIGALTRVLLSLRHKALELPEDDPAYGMLAGWSEADSCLEPDPSRYMQPYLSNSSEAARGLHDLGRAWISAAHDTSDPELAQQGLALVQEAARLRTDLARAIDRSILQVDGQPMLPAIAGVSVPFDAAVAQDGAAPQFRAYRAYCELLYSALLRPEQTRLITDYRARRHAMILGLPTAYGPGSYELASFLAYGQGYGLIYADRVPEALLMLYGGMAHQYTRGNWLAPETRRLLSDAESAPYAVPAQLFAPLMTRWLLVLEDPERELLWLGKAIPRAWLQDGKLTGVKNAPTRWGKVSFTLGPDLEHGSIRASVRLPPQGIAAETRLRVRAPAARRMQAVTLNGRPYRGFDPAQEFVSLPAATGGEVELVIHY